jgi:hypothetical protein
LEDVAVVEYGGEELSRDLVVVAGGAGVEAGAEDVEEVAEHVGLHFAEVELGVLIEVVFGGGDDEGGGGFRVCFFCAHEVVAVGAEVEVEFWPEGVEAVFVADHLHAQHLGGFDGVVELAFEEGERVVGEVVGADDCGGGGLVYGVGGLGDGLFVGLLEDLAELAALGDTDLLLGLIELEVSVLKIGFAGRFGLGAF